MPEMGRGLSASAVEAVKAALRSSLREVSRARHDYPPVYNFQAALDEIDALTAPARPQRASCGACGNPVERVGSGSWVDPVERENDGDLCLLNELSDGHFGPHAVGK